MAVSAREVSLLKTFALFLIVLSLASFVVLQTHTLTSSKAKADGLPSDTPFDTPTPTPPAPLQKAHVVTSYDGKKKLMIQVSTVSGGMNEYTVSVSSVDGSDQKTVLTKTMAGMLDATINTWSPDDRYVFLVARETGGHEAYYVLQANGEPFAGGEAYLDVGSLWSERKIDYTIRTASGWASPTLLILYTTKQDGSRGPSYWFEVPSKSFLQLAS